jgi:hypothetical protein
VALCTLDDIVVFKVRAPGYKRWANPAGRVVTIEDDDLRPLVVIDPENREQVERLTNMFGQERANSVFHPDRPLMADQMQAALREFADPKPPRCPAALIIRGEHFACDSAEGHGLPHGNSTAEAIWGESE